MLSEDGSTVRLEISAHSGLSCSQAILFTGRSIALYERAYSD